MFSVASMDWLLLSAEMDGLHVANWPHVIAVPAAECSGFCYRD